MNRIYSRLGIFSSHELKSNESDTWLRIPRNLGILTGNKIKVQSWNMTRSDVGPVFKRNFEARMRELQHSVPRLLIINFEAFRTILRGHWFVRTLVLSPRRRMTIGPEIGPTTQM